MIEFVQICATGTKETPNYAPSIPARMYGLTEYCPAYVTERPRRLANACQAIDARLEERVFVEHAPAEQATEGYIEIFDAGSGNRVVTAIELLSESNNCSRDAQSQYLRKQREYLLGGVSLVEIDLSRRQARVGGASNPHPTVQDFAKCPNPIPLDEPTSHPQIGATLTTKTAPERLRIASGIYWSARRML